jgi:hypothetical protein
MGGVGVLPYLLPSTTLIAHGSHRVRIARQLQDFDEQLASLRSFARCQCLLGLVANAGADAAAVKRGQQ